MTGNMSQRWPGASTSALSVASSAAVGIENAFPFGRGCSACRAFGWGFRRYGCRRGFRFRRRGLGRRRSRWCSRSASRCSAEAGHVRNQSFHIGSIHRQRDHARGLHLRRGRFQKCCQLIRRILTGNMSQRWPGGAASALSVASSAAVRIENAFPRDGGRCCTA